jgi:hypothetical protein
MMTQRWNGGRDSYRPAGEVIRTSDYDVAPIAQNAVAKAFVEAHHYSGTYPAARFRFGLYRRGALAGVAVFSHPCSDRVLTKVFPVDDPKMAVELGRFVLLDDVAGNGETWMLGRCFDMLRSSGIADVVSFSDPMPRMASDGRVVLPGHLGIIYQAHNAVYLGRGDRRTLRIMPDGRSFNHRAEQKIRGRESGWKYAAHQLEAHGAEPLTEAMDANGWLDVWVPRLTRPLRHLGNHKYAWAVDKALRRHLQKSLPYPKQTDRGAA